MSSAEEQVGSASDGGNASEVRDGAWRKPRRGRCQRRRRSRSLPVSVFVCTSVLAPADFTIFTHFCMRRSRAVTWRRVVAWRGCGWGTGCIAFGISQPCGLVVPCSPRAPMGLQSKKAGRIPPGNRSRGSFGIPRQLRSKDTKFQKNVTNRGHVSTSSKVGAMHLPCRDSTSHTASAVLCPLAPLPGRVKSTIVSTRLVQWEHTGQ